MAEKTTAQKLQVKAGDRVRISGGTAEEHALVGAWPEGVTTIDSGEVDVAVTVVHTRAELLDQFARGLPALTGARAVWYIYPKGGRADVNRDVIMREAGAFGWRANSNISVDDVWSAVRVRPLADGEAPVG